jgi:hypothetical protein
MRALSVAYLLFRRRDAPAVRQVGRCGGARGALVTVQTRHAEAGEPCGLDAALWLAAGIRARAAARSGSETPWRVDAIRRSNRAACLTAGGHRRHAGDPSSSPARLCPCPAAGFMPGVAATADHDRTATSRTPLTFLG